MSGLVAARSESARDNLQGSILSALLRKHHSGGHSNAPAHSAADNPLNIIDFSLDRSNELWAFLGA